jgi:FtsP/CotA-like multicopper oxidase with cupredoxin domain
MFLLAVLLFCYSVFGQTSCTGTPASVTIPWNVRHSSTQIGTEAATFITVENKWPPDPVIVSKCTLVNIDVTNWMADEDVTLHFHGILQTNGQVVMDGPEGLTQR